MKYETAKAGSILRSYATHHQHGEGWTYSRDTGDLEAIYYKHSRTGYDHWTKRYQRAIREFFAKIIKGGSSFEKQLMGDYWKQPSLRRRFSGAWIAFKVYGRRDKGRPDGQINGNPMHWEEDGEYIQCVGPTVGEKIADFLENEPANPYAVAIAEEMNRIWELSMKRHREYEAKFDKTEEK